MSGDRLSLGEPECGFFSLLQLGPSLFWWWLGLFLLCGLFELDNTNVTPLTSARPESSSPLHFPTFQMSDVVVHVKSSSQAARVVKLRQILGAICPAEIIEIMGEYTEELPFATLFVAPQYSWKYCWTSRDWSLEEQAHFAATHNGEFPPYDGEGFFCERCCVSKGDRNACSFFCPLVSIILMGFLFGTGLVPA